MNLEGIWVYILHTHTGEPGEHFSYTHTHTHTHTQVNLDGIYLIHTQVNMEGIYLTHTHRILFGLKNRNPASGTTMGEPGGHCPK